MSQLATSGLGFGTIVSVVREQINKNLAFAPVLEVRKGRNPSGPTFVASGTIASSLGSGTVHSEGGNFPTADNDNRVQASLGWGRYHGSIEVTDEALANGAASGNPAEYATLWLRALKEKTRTVAKLIEHDCFTSAGANHIVGLDDAIGDPTATYAGLDRNTHDKFVPHVVAPGSLTTITKKSIRDFFGGIADNGGEGYPNVAFCTNPTLNTVGALYEGQVRYNEGPLAAVLGEAQRRSIMIEGCTFIAVDSADGYTSANNGWIYAINTNFVYFEAIPYLDSAKVLPFAGLPLGMQIVTDPTGAHSERAVIRTRLQLVVEKPSACGVLKDIDVS